MRDHNRGMRAQARSERAFDAFSFAYSSSYTLVLLGNVGREGKRRWL